jgi:two-component system nitrogen regulation sensor histidine kinase NtrY
MTTSALAPAGGRSPRARPPAAAAPGAGRRLRPPLRDNPRVILLVILLLGAAFAGLVLLADSSTELRADFLSEVVLYALSVADLTMLVALAFVLARNIVKLVVERRRGLPFARFRSKLVAALLGLTIVPAVLVLVVGSELIRNSANRWFSPPIEEVLGSATRIAADYYRERGRIVRDHAVRIARALPPALVAGGQVAAVRDVIAPEVAAERVGMVEVYQVRRGAGDQADVVPLVAVEAPTLPRDRPRASADRLAARAAAGAAEADARDALAGGDELVRAAALVRDAAGRPVGVVVASDHLAGEVATAARRITDAFEAYTQVKVLRRPLEGVYLSFFLMVTLMILVSATWMGLYIAKRIARPVQALAAGARAIGAGELDHRIEPESADEFGGLVEAFNAMAAELAANRRKLERSRLDLERKTQEIDDRRRYFETILERIATGVVAVGPDGRVSAMNRAAVRLLGLEAVPLGEPVDRVLAREDLAPLRRLLAGGAAAAGAAAQEVSIVRDGQELRLAAAATALQSQSGAVEGHVLVFDDVTPLIRAQRVAAWRDVARRLAHEIKNPLTPIQLSAERLRRQFGHAPPPTRALVEECTATIIAEVESLKALVDEFAQFARMPAPKTVPTDLHALLRETLALYNGVVRTVRIERRFAEKLPVVRVDPEQIRRVVVNLVDNAVEALGGPDGRGPSGEPGLIVVGTEHDPAGGVVRLVVADNGPGIAEADREKLFMPYYSTKRRGSGLGLAIVRRIVVEHGGSIEVGPNSPRGTCFTVELPC